MRGEAGHGARAGARGEVQGGASVPVTLACPVCPPPSLEPHPLSAGPAAPACGTWLVCSGTTPVKKH